MGKIDLEYLCKTIGNLCGFPVRLFQGEVEAYHLDHAHLSCDPLRPYRSNLFAIEAHVGYFITPIHHYYGLVCKEDTRIILGPSRQMPVSDQQLRELAFLCDVPTDETPAFLQAMRTLVPMPLESLLQVLCTLNHVLNSETLSLGELTMRGAEIPSVQMVSTATTEEYLANDTHSTLAVEQTLMNIIRKGDVEALKAWIVEAPAVHAGPMVADVLRQYRNTFIVSTTLASRAAIRGGMDANEALSLSDLLIRNCEVLRNVQDILSLQMHMMLTYTESVQKIHLGKQPTPLAAEVARYIRQHLSESISADAMADALHISRPHLSRQFKLDTGMILTDYILTQKSEEAGRLLATTDKSIASIREYLCFSSPSHFARVFQKYMGMTPTAYAKKHRMN